MDEQQIVVETNPRVTEEFVDNSPEADPAADVIAQIAAEFEAEAGAEDAGTAKAAADAPEGTEASAEDAEATETVATEPTEESPAEDAGLERLVAREVALREKEAEFKAREAKFTEIEKENAALKEQVAKIPTDFIEEMRVRPWEALEAAGHDPDQVIRLCLAAKMTKEGKPLPAELSRAIKDAEAEYKQTSLEKRQAAFEQRVAAEAFAKKVESDALAYVKKGISKDAPTVASVAKANSERVYSEILDEVGRDAHARRGEPGAQLISFDEAARRVEKRWAEMKALFGSEAASTTVDEKKSTPSTTEASKKQTTPKAAAAPKVPLTKPKAKTQKELEDEAVEAGLQEFKRAELARKQARA